MTKIEKIEDLLQGIEADVHNSLLKRITATIEDLRTEASDEEQAGITATLEIIAANFYTK